MRVFLRPGVSIRREPMTLGNMREVGGALQVHGHGKREAPDLRAGGWGALAAGVSGGLGRSRHRAQPSYFTEPEDRKLRLTIYPATCRPTDEQRRALQLLARSPSGCTEALLMAHGFEVAMLSRLVLDGLAVAVDHSTTAGRRRMKVTWLRITNAGRKAITQ
jgi:hypothetical protein